MQLVNDVIKKTLNTINRIERFFGAIFRASWKILKVHSHQTRMSVMGGGFCSSSSLLAKCIPVFVKVRRCIYSSGYPHTTTITLSSIVVSDFLPPLVMTSLLEHAPDWLKARISAKVQIFQLARFARIAPQDFLSRLCIDLTCKSFARFASFASGVNAP